MTTKCPPMQRPWNECNDSPYSFCFDIQEGFKGCVRVTRIPEDMCMFFEEYNYTCCNTVLEYDPVLDNKCANDPRLCIGCPGKVELPPGRYRMVGEDKDGNPFIPEPDEILVRVHHETC